MGYHVLIADDMATNRKLIKAVIDKDNKDITFLEAANGSATLDFLQQGNIDLVILDLMMPEKDGFQVLREMKANEPYKDIPVIIYSAMESIDSINEALRLGAYDYFTKPLTPEQIKIIVPLKVKNALESYEQRKALVTIHENLKIELMLAKMFQQNLMAETGEFACADMYGKYVPCDELGGDFYDCHEYNGALWFIVAEVSGQGVPAAMISSMLKMEFANCVKTLEYPQEVLGHINRTFCPLLQGLYNISAFVGKIRQNEFYYSNAGHSYPLLYNSRKNQVRILELGGPILGLADSLEFPFGSVPIHDNDLILAYTNGLLEARSWNEEAREYEELRNYIMQYKAMAEKAPAEFIAMILQLYANVGNARARDDIAVMMLKAK
jgi:sigma-B regulation protein RsbU (phosphoserine phosphatase)